MNKSFHERRIITFYSYKGGTGRSMALANTACALAKRQQRNILMVDWDLDAPGLHYYFLDYIDNEDNVDGRPGLIDLFLEINNKISAFSEQGVLSDEDSKKIVQQIQLDKYTISTTVPGLMLICAGRFDQDYRNKVNTFKWEELFNRAPSLFRLFADLLYKEYYYTFIDSRTGITDIGNICTSLMPDTLVTVFTPNRQSIDGCLEMIKDATDYRKHTDDLRPLIAYPLVSRLELGEADLRDAWRLGNESKNIISYQKEFEMLFQQVYDLPDSDLNNYFDKTLIPHVSKYAYGEEIAVLTEPREDNLSLSRVYNSIIDFLIYQPEPWLLRKTNYRDSVYYRAPGGAIDWHNPNEKKFYIQHDIDKEIFECIHDQRMIVLYGTKYTGKTSCLGRLYYKLLSDFQSIYIDFESFSDEILKNIDLLWIQVILEIAEKLELEWQSEQYSDFGGVKRNVKSFLQNHVFKNSQKPLLLLFDNCHSILNTQAQEFFSNIRAMYNDKLNKPFQKIHWLITTAVSKEFFIVKKNESPFSIGKVFELKPFTDDELYQFAELFGLTINDEQIYMIKEYLGGNPYLTHRLFYHIKTITKSVNKLNAILEESDIFDDYLLTFDKDTVKPMKQIIANKKFSDNMILSDLQAKGLIVKNKESQWNASNKIVENFFKREIEE